MEVDGQVISADHETGDSDLYVRKLTDDGNREIVFYLSVGAAKELSYALQKLIEKMEYEAESLTEE
jgi:hypothetical protein